MRNLVLLSFAAVAAACARAAGPAVSPVRETVHATRQAIDSADLLARVAVLAHDSMLGRESGTIGNQRAEEYIAREVSRLGLEPAGERGGYYQTVPLVMRAPDPASSLTGAGFALRYRTDLLPLRPLGGAALGGRFAGSGVASVYGGRIGETTIEPDSARGKLVVFAPRLGSDGRPTLQTVGVTGAALDRYRVAAGIVIAGLEVLPVTALAFLEQPVMAAAPDPAAPPAVAAARITTAAAELIMNAPLGALAIGAAGRAVTGAFGVLARTPVVPSRNVLAIVRGRDPALRGTYVAVGSHSDHVGTALAPLDHDSVFAFNRVLRRSGANEPARSPNYDQERRIRGIRDSLRAIRPARRDSIFNGADDNASAVAVALEVAEQLVTAPPRRSVLFVWHTAEEKGLFGAAHFTDHPTVPRDSIVAQVNMDQVSRGGPEDIEGARARTLYVLGSRRLSRELGNLVEQVNARPAHQFVLDYSLDAPGHPANGYCRSDHYMYARYGIPVVFFSAGWHPDYHMVTDETQYVRAGTMFGVAQLVRDLVETVADADQRPALSAPRPDARAACRQ